MPRRFDRDCPGYLSDSDFRRSESSDDNSDYDFYDDYQHPTRLYFQPKSLLNAIKKRLGDETRNWSNPHDIELNALLRAYMKASKGDIIIREGLEYHNHIHIIHRLTQIDVDIDTLLNGRFWPTEALAWLCKCSTSLHYDEPVDLARDLLDLGARINEAHLYNKHCLFNTDHDKLIELLVHEGADIDVLEPTSGDTILHRVAELDYLDEMNLLISKGADIKKLNNLNEDLLCVSLNTGASRTIRYLLELYDYPASRMHDGYQLLGCIALYDKWIYHHFKEKDAYQDRLRTTFEYWRKAESYVIDQTAPDSLTPSMLNHTMDLRDVMKQALLISDCLIDHSKHKILFQILHLSTLIGDEIGSIELRLRTFEHIILPNNIKTTRCFGFINYLLDDMIQNYGYKSHSSYTRFISILLRLPGERIDDTEGCNWTNIIVPLIHLRFLIVANFDSRDISEKLIEDAIYFNNSLEYNKQRLLYEILNFYKDCQSSYLRKLFVKLVKKGINLVTKNSCNRIERLVVREMINPGTKFEPDDLALIMQSLFDRGLCICPGVIGSNQYKRWSKKVYQKFTVPKLTCLSAWKINRYKLKFDANDLEEDYLNIIHRHQIK